MTENLLQTKAAPRSIADGASWLRQGILAVFHGVLLYGLFDRLPWAATIALYLRDWLVAEIIALVFTPYFVMLTVRDHADPLWHRALWLPMVIVVMGGIGGTVRLLQATWFYILTCIPVLWVEQTAAQSQLGCGRSVLKFVVLIVLLTVFGNRPLQFPIGTLAGKWMDPEMREMANSMACATAYFGITAVIEFFIWRAARRPLSRPD